jgi:tRNA modification GTPase
MQKTIAAISTPAGIGGIAVIRVSGTDSIKIADRIFRGKDKLQNAQTHTVHYGHIIDEKKKVIDEVLVSVMRAPRTFTREDVVEISTHGGITASRTVLDALIRAGASLAEPGEFTKRAFLNGRIDLSQAEAVIDIIHSQTQLAQENAMSQLSGGLSAKINEIRQTLVSLAAGMQVGIDYPDEDLEDVTIEEIESVCLSCRQEVDTLLSTADSGTILRDGLLTVIAGRPNVGKSSLLNALSMQERAIVTEIAGTTRDAIEELVNLDGVPLRLLDTAGIRATEDVVEKIGVQKSQQYIDSADLILVVLDAQDGIGREDEEILVSTKEKKRIVLVNKTDISTPDISLDGEETVITISAKTGEGIDTLRQTIKRMYRLGAVGQSNGQIITNLRHKQALVEAQESLTHALDAISLGLEQDLVSMDIAEAIDALGKITGATVSEDIVNAIFHDFCVGK